LENKTERLFRDIERRMRKFRPTVPEPAPIATDPGEEQIEKYEYHVMEIMKHVREARAYAPCRGCARSIDGIKLTTLSSLTALAIFKEMTSENKTRADITDEEIERIKKEVERKYQNY